MIQDKTIGNRIFDIMNYTLSAAYCAHLRVTLRVRVGRILHKSRRGSQRRLDPVAEGMVSCVL